MDDSGWQTLMDETDAALARARLLVAQQATDSADLEAAHSLMTRLPEFKRDLSIARARERSAIASYRSIFEQLVTTLRAIG